MMKNKKLMVLFILVVAFLLVMVTYASANDDVGELPTIVVDQNNVDTQNSANNEQNSNTANNNVANINNNANTSENTIANISANVANNEVLPQTGVQGDTTLFIFIGICIVSAIYAYFKIRKYNNVH